MISPENDRVKTLEEQVARLERQVEALREVLVRRVESETAARLSLNKRLGRMESQIDQALSTGRLLLDSRIWRTLQSGGALLLNLQRITKGSQRVLKLSREERKAEIQLRCDSLPPDPKDEICGTIEIRGWAVSPSGIESVEISVGSEPPLLARYGSVRHDVATLYEDLPAARLSGYHATFDTRKLPDGGHTVTITAKARSGARQEMSIPILVNQELGRSSEYQRWLEVFEEREPEMARLRIAGFAYSPLVSILVPVYKTGLEILATTIDSVRRQSYPHWELCLVDDGSRDRRITSLLEKVAGEDRRIRFQTQEQSGISAASNRALAMSRGEYVALLDHDDTLDEDALYHVVAELQETPRPGIIYTDEDHMDEAGRRSSPFFKPDWSPDLILAENYVCHFMVFQRELAEKAGGFRSDFDLSQDHDLLLRMSRHTDRIAHVPRVLYHWRTEIASMERASNSEDKAIASSRGVIEAFVRESGLQARVEEGAQPGRWRVRYSIPNGSRVTIVIPTAGKTAVLDRNLTSLWERAGYDDYEIVIIDNSKGSAIEDYVSGLQRKGRPVRIFDQRNQPFNYSRLNNLAVQACDTPLLLFLNDDTEGISQGWLEAMVELAARPEVGAVGAKLLYPNGLIQHAGVTMGLAGLCGHSFKGARGDQRHYFDFPDLIRNVSAVTAACVMVRNSVFREVKGFDERTFPIAYNDIDLALRIGKAGYRVLYTPHALLYHHEAFSKSAKDMNPHPAETLGMRTRWRDVIARDPFYNPNLTRHLENWSLRWD